jgi:hypothetical protein
MSEKTHTSTRYVFSHSSGALNDADVLSQFIAVHIRRGDFAVYCGDRACYPALSVYARQVEEVKKEIYEKKGIVIRDVVVTASMLFYLAGLKFL